MKKYDTLVILLLIFFNLVSCNTNTQIADETGVQSFKIDCVYEAFDIGLDKDNVYICDKDKIYLYNEGKKINTIEDIFEIGFCIAVDGGNLYTFDNTGHSLQIMTIHGEMIDTIPTSKEGFAQKIEADEENIYILQKEYNKENNSSFFISILNKTGKNTTVLQKEGLVNFSILKNGFIVLAIQKESITYLSVYDVKNKRETSNIRINSLINDFTCDRNNYVYYTVGGSARKISMDSQKDETIYSYNKGFFGRIKVNEDDCFLLDSVNQVVYKVAKNYSVNKQISDITLLAHFSGYENEIRMADAIDKFKKLYPKANLRFVTYENLQYYDTLKKKIMAGDTDFDIFLMNNNDCFDFIRNEAMVNLNAYHALMQKFDTMFKGILNNCKYDEYVYGVPESISVNSWKVNEALLNELGLKCPEGFWTWNEFYSFAKSACKDMDSDGAVDVFAIASNKRFPEFYDQYNCTSMDLINGIVSYSNDNFIAMLKLWKKLWNENMIIEIRNLSTNKKNILFSEEKIALNEGESHLVCIPGISEDPVYPSSFNLLCVNRYSKNKEIAIEFLSVLISREVQTAHPETGSAFYTDLSSYSDIDKKFSLPLSGSKNYSMYENIINNSSPRRYNKDINVYAGDLMEKCFDGEIDPETVAELLDKKAKMITGE